MKKFEVYDYPDSTGRSPLLGAVYAIDRAEANDKAQEKFGTFMYLVEVH
jgi:hypothetical protein